MAIRSLVIALASGSLIAAAGCSTTEKTANQKFADQLSAALTFDLPHVEAKPVSRWLVVAYDDLYSIEYEVDVGGLGVGGQPLGSSIAAQQEIGQV